MSQQGGPNRVGTTARRGTFAPPPTDLFTKYAHIKDRGKRAIAFIEGECLVPSGRGMNKPYKLMPHQKRDIRTALSDPEALVTFISAPRGWGKTGLIAALLVWALYDEEGAQVVMASTAMRTARIPYDRAVRIITLNPTLASQALIFYNAAQPQVELPHRGSIMVPLPAEERHIVGLSPTFILVDEIGYVSASTYEAMQTSLGKTDSGVLIAIGTPGLGVMDGAEPNLMYAMRERTLSDTPPKMVRYIEYAAPPDAPPDRVSTWRKANPGVGTLVDPKAIANDYATMPLSRFGQMRLGLWTQHESAWMLVEDWDALDIIPGPPTEGSSIAIGFDGSVGGDSTVMTFYEPAMSRAGVLGAWERPQNAREWKVPRKEVMDTFEMAFTRYNVIVAFCDPYFWRESLQRLAEVYGEDKVVEFATNHAGRMAPATDAFRTAVVTGEMTWDGNPVLRAHILSAVAKQTPVGDVIVKDARKPQHIDAAVSVILAKEGARTVEEQPAPMFW